MKQSRPEQIGFGWPQSLTQIWRMMKLATLLLFIGCLQVSATAYSQKTAITISLDDVSLEDAFSAITQESGYLFLYSNEKLVNIKGNVSLNVNDATIDQVMDACLKKLQLSYMVMGKTIVIIPKPDDAENNAKLEDALPNNEITGVVKDQATGEPLVGVSIKIKGENSGTITNAEGKFKLEVPEDAVLEISYLGYVSKEVSVNGRQELELFLQAATTGLDQLVVVGYGTQTKDRITSAIATIGQDQIASRPVTDVTNILQGNVAGVNFSTSATESSPVGGELGHEIKFNIRGVGSINGGQPYVLVDGIEQSLQNVNPADIKSITVLKDASASAIYGSRAAYGVVLVTTKSGRAGKAQISYQGRVGFSSPINMPEMMNSIEFAHYINKRNLSIGNKIIFSEEKIEKMKEFMQAPYSPGLPGLGLNADGSNWGTAYDNQYANTDWFDYYFRNTSPIQMHNLSIRGGTEKVEYYVGLGYVSQKGLLNKVNDNMQKYYLNTKIEIQSKEWLSFNVNNNLTFRKINRPMANQTIFYGLIGNAYPNRPTHLPVKSKYDLPTWNEFLYLNNSNYAQNRLSDALKLAVTVSPYKNWDINAAMKIRFDVDNNSFTLKRPRYEKADGSILIIEGNKQGFQYPGMRWQNTRFGSYTIGRRHNVYLSPDINSTYTYVNNGLYLKAMAGFQAEVQNNSSDFVYKDGMMSEDVYSFDNANGVLFAGESRNHWSTMGVYSRINLGYKNIYLLELSGRYDGSSRFAPEHRWGLFPSFSVGYNIAETEYFNNLNTVFSQLKLRFSYGRLGNQNGAGLYDYISSMPLDPNNANAWLLPGGNSTIEKGTIALVPSLVSPTITWEKVDNMNLGLDFMVFDEKLTGTINLYQRVTRDMIGPAEAIPSIAGIPSSKRSKANNATLKNRGWELSINWQDEFNSGFTYGVGLNLFDHKVIVTEYNNPKGIIYNNHTGLKRNKGYYPGMNIGEIWGYKADDLFQSNNEVDNYLSRVDLSYFKPNSFWRAGDVRYEDINGDGKVSPGEGTLSNHGDLAIIGNTTPRYSFGLNFMMGYKGFRIDALFQGIGKRDFPMAGSTYLFGGRNYFKSHLDYFDYNHLDAYLPRLTDPKQIDYQVNTGYNTTRYLLNAAYMRMKNITISYTFDKDVLQRIGFGNLRVYVSADNLFTISSLPDQFDPETINQVNTWAGGSNEQAPALTSALQGNGNGKVYPLNKKVTFGINITF